MKLSEKLNCRWFFRKKWNFHKIPCFLPKMGKIFGLQESAVIGRKNSLVIATELKKYWQRAKDIRNLNLTILAFVIQQLWKRRLWNLKTSYFEAVYSDFQLFIQYLKLFFVCWKCLLIDYTNQFSSVWRFFILGKI